MADRWMEDVAVADLVEAEKNAKAHDEELIDASLDRFGYIEPIVLDERTGRIISGHGRRERLLAAQAAGDPPPEGVSIDAEGRWVVKVVRGWASPDDAEAEAAGIALNRIGERGGWRPDVLAEMLGNLSSTTGLVGVGFGTGDVDLLIAGLAQPDLAALAPSDEWVGMPEFEQPDGQAAYSTTIHFPTQEDAVKFWVQVFEKPEPHRTAWWPENDGHIGSSIKLQYVADTVE